MLKKALFFLVSYSAFAFSMDIDLSFNEKSFYSQNGEDGVIAKIFQLIDPSSKSCVEIGARDGMLDSNTCLLRLQHWKALLLDKSYEKEENHLYKEFIVAENINEIFKKYEVPFDITLLSIDTSYNGFYFWKALDEKYKPSLVLIKYNAVLLPSEDKVVKYRPLFTGDKTTYFGASLLALHRLARAKGYSLVYVESSGTTAFFVRDDLLTDKPFSFKDTNDVEKLYRRAVGKRREPDTKKREYVKPQEL